MCIKWVCILLQISFFPKSATRITTLYYFLGKLSSTNLYTLPFIVSLIGILASISVRKHWRIPSVTLWRGYIIDSEKVRSLLLSSSDSTKWLLLNDPDWYTLHVRLSLDCWQWQYISKAPEAIASMEDLSIQVWAHAPDDIDERLHKEHEWTHRNVNKYSYIQFPHIDVPQLAHKVLIFNTWHSPEDFEHPLGKYISIDVQISLCIWDMLSRLIRKIISLKQPQKNQVCQIFLPETA